MSAKKQPKSTFCWRCGKVRVKSPTISNVGIMHASPIHCVKCKDEIARDRLATVAATQASLPHMRQK